MKKWPVQLTTQLCNSFSLKQPPYFGRHKVCGFCFVLFFCILFILLHKSFKRGTLQGRHLITITSTGILSSTMDFFSHWKHVAVRNTMINDYLYSLRSLIDIFMYQQFYSPLLLYHEGKCQHNESSMNIVSVLLWKQFWSWPPKNDSGPSRISMDHILRTTAV